MSIIPYDGENYIVIASAYWGKAMSIFDASGVLPDGLECEPWCFRTLGDVLNEDYQIPEDWADGLTW